MPLLERVGRGVMLTRHGRHLVDAGARLLTDLEEIESGLHLQAGAVAGHLRVVAFSTAMRGMVAPAVRDLLDAHPDLTIALSEREPWDTIDLVASGQCEIGLVHSWGDVPLAIPDHLAPDAGRLRRRRRDRPPHPPAGRSQDRSPRATWSTRAGSPRPRARSAASG